MKKRSSAAVMIAIYIYICSGEKGERRVSIVRKRDGIEGRVSYLRVAQSYIYREREG